MIKVMLFIIGFLLLNAMFIYGLVYFILWLLQKMREPLTSLERSRLSKGLCVKCGYDLRASKHRCPECGTPVPPE
jgi:hypothetical protein